MAIKGRALEKVLTDYKSSVYLLIWVTWPVHSTIVLHINEDPSYVQVSRFVYYLVRVRCRPGAGMN
jgi:hypothetical protein